MAIMVPFGGPLKPPDLQVKLPFGSGIRVLWGQQRTRLAPRAHPETRNGLGSP
jgi:hypothetical protein